MPHTPFPSLTAQPSSRYCSNCNQLMSLYTLPRHYGQTLQLDLCLPCHLIWFDPGENLQLTPDATMALFQLIHQHGSASDNHSARIDTVLSCITCNRTLRHTQDRTLRNRFSYRACPQGHGRLVSFYNFLAEKHFVRELTPIERNALSVSVRQINCSSCGGRIDLSRDDACSYCRAPLSVFDRDAALHAVEHYLQRRQLLPTAALPPPTAAGHDALASLGHAHTLRNRPGVDIVAALGQAGSHNRPAASPGAVGSAGTMGALGTLAGTVIDLVADGITSLLAQWD